MHDDEDGGSAMVDVTAVLDLLRTAGVPYTSIGTGGGTITVYVGDGDFDEETERFTHPLSIGPCHWMPDEDPTTRPHNRRLMGGVGELGYGDREDGKGVDEPTPPERIAADLIAMYETTKGAAR